jgi:hypothetical protein
LDLTRKVIPDMFFLDKVMQLGMSQQAVLVLALQYIRHLGEEYEVDTEEGFLRKLKSIADYS